MSSTLTYEELCAAHRWDVPPRYNIAADVCDKHPRDKLAMIWESFDGTTRELDWGELQDLANQAAYTLRARGIGKGDRVAVVLPADARDRGDLLRRLEARRDPALDVGPLRRRRDRAPPPRLRRCAARHRSGQRAALRPPRVARRACARGRHAQGAPTAAICEDTSADDPAQLYYTSGTTGLAKGIVHAHRYILAHEEFIYSHEVQDGERFHGMGEWAWAAGIAPLLGPGGSAPCNASTMREAGFDPAKQLDFLSRHQVTNVFTTPTAMRSMMSIEDAGTRYPQRFRRVCSAGEPLNPEAIRWFRDQYGVTVLDYYGLTESYPLVGNYPFLEVREGSMGKPMPGWDVQILDEDERPVAQGERGEICLRARSNPHYPLGYWAREEAGVEAFGGEWFHTKDAAVQDEDGYYWYVGRADDVIIAAGYRIGPFEVESRLPRAPRRPRGRGRRLARRAARQRRQGVRRARGGLRAHGRPRRRDQGVRPRPPLRLRIPAPHRVRRRPAEDAHRQDPPHRAAAA